MAPIRPPPRASLSAPSSGSGRKRVKTHHDEDEDEEIHDSVNVGQTRATTQVQAPNDYSYLMSLPAEILNIVLQSMGPPPTGEQYELKDLDDIHPCYAIMSTNKALAQYYIQEMGEPCKNIRVTIQRWDYVFDKYADSDSDTTSTVDTDTTTAIQAGPNLNERLISRLARLGHEGLRRVSGINLEGPQFSIDTGYTRTTAFLRDHRRTTRLDPEEKLLIKQFMEEEIEDKTEVIKEVFDTLNTVFKFKSVNFLRIVPGELPANGYLEPLRSFVLAQIDNLKSVFFVETHEHNTARSHYPYLQRLTRPSYFPHRIDQPKNYPVSKASHRHRYAEIAVTINALLNSRVAVEKLSADRW